MILIAIYYVVSASSMLSDSSTCVMNLHLLFFSVYELTANVRKFERMMKDSCHIKSGIHTSLA